MVNENKLQRRVVTLILGSTILGVDFVLDILIFHSILEFHDPESKCSHQSIMVFR